MRTQRLLLASLLALSVSVAMAVPSLVEDVHDGVCVVRDDAGNFGGLTNGITHQNRGDYTARKTLDLSDVPAAVWDATREVRLSLYLTVRDYSWHDLPKANGLDETYQIVINGEVHSYPTRGGAPVYPEGKDPNPAFTWYDFEVPKAQFKRGPNEILVRKAPDSKGDDYLYLGIDNSVKRGNSAVAFDGKKWTQEKLTIPGGNGEYMVRLYLLQKDTTFAVRYAPGQTPPLDDPAQLLKYVGARGAEKTAAGTVLKPGQALRLEWSPASVDSAAALQATVAVAGQAECAWLDADDKPASAARGDGSLKLENPDHAVISGLLVRPVAGPVTVHSVTIAGSRSYHPQARPVNLCPAIAPPACGREFLATTPTCTISGKTLTLDNGRLRARFETDGKLRLVSLYNAITRTEMVRQPDAVWLFAVMTGDKWRAGSRDFALKSIKSTATGFVAELTAAEPALAATLTATVDGEGLRLSLKLVNTGPAAVDFKLSFPHLAGLAVSEQAARDYYYYPWGGGIFSDCGTLIRRGYGDHEALYQVMDLYSPQRGGGMYLRLDDSEGWHKILSLRKVVPGAAEANGDALVGVKYRVREEYRTPSPLEVVPGTGLSTEYLRRTRPPGGAFAPAEAVLAAHAGDWHTAMASYAEWAHQVWQWRPYPSRLKSVHNMMAAGWGQGILFKDGKYRTDIIQEAKPGFTHTQTDCIELMSWWDWSPLGPFSTPFDQLGKVLTPAQIKGWEHYFVNDPVTGQKMWNNQPGDYSGYNERFGGLPAFRQAVKTYQELGALTTLYTDPFRLDENCPIGRAHGKEWCVVNQEGKLSTGYEVFNPCHDLPAVRQWVAETMGRVMRETGADGIRLDEYGHRGWACYSPDHKHTYQEPGITQWQKATAEATRMVHEAMDKVRPGLVLTTEHPGYDYLMQYLDGCITYDFTVMATPLRPLECNLQRFYFPECKAYELDHRGADPGDKKKFWNAVESFGRYYPTAYYTILNENEDAYQGRSCTPLLYTPGNAPGIYVNRFSAGDKHLYHLYNASGFTFDGIALAVKLNEGQHLVDMLTGEELDYTFMPNTDLVYMRAYLPRKDVGCIAQLTRRLEATRTGQRLQVQVSTLPTAGTLVVADRDGRALLTQPAKAGGNEMDLSKLPVAGTPLVVKLLAGKTLVDMVPVPEE